MAENHLEQFPGRVNTAVSGGPVNQPAAAFNQRRARAIAALQSVHRSEAGSVRGNLEQHALAGAAAGRCRSIQVPRAVFDQRRRRIIAVVGAAELVQNRKARAVAVEPEHDAVPTGPAARRDPIQQTVRAEGQRRRRNRTAGVDESAVHAVEFVQNRVAGAVRLQRKDGSGARASAVAGDPIQRPVRALNQAANRKRAVSVRAAGGRGSERMQRRKSAAVRVQGKHNPVGVCSAVLGFPVERPAGAFQQGTGGQSAVGVRLSAVGGAEGIQRLISGAVGVQRKQ